MESRENFYIIDDVIVLLYLLLFWGFLLGEVVKFFWGKLV